MCVNKYIHMYTYIYIYTYTTICRYILNIATWKSPKFFNFSSALGSKALPHGETCGAAMAGAGPCGIETGGRWSERCGMWKRCQWDLSNMPQGVMENAWKMDGNTWILHIYLVGGNWLPWIWLIFPFINWVSIIILIDELIFFRGVALAHQPDRVFICLSELLKSVVPLSRTMGYDW